MALISEGVSHAGYGGIAVAIAVGSLAPLFTEAPGLISVKVKQLQDDYQNSFTKGGITSWSWDGTDAHGNVVATGPYTATVKAVAVLNGQQVTGTAPAHDRANHAGLPGNG